MLCLTQNIYKLSQHETQNFPFCAMAINLTRTVVNVMKLNLLNKLYNKSNGQLVHLSAKFFAALYYNLYLKWIHDVKTIKDAGFVLNSVEENAKKSPLKLLKQLDRYLDKNSKRTQKYKFTNIPKIVIQKAESIDQEFSRLD